MKKINIFAIVLATFVFSSSINAYASYYVSNGTKDSNGFSYYYSGTDKENAVENYSNVILLVNGDPVTAPLAVPSFIRNGNTYVQIKALSNKLNYEVSYDTITKKITVTGNDHVAVFDKNNGNVYSDGKLTYSNTYIPTIEGYTFVPLRPLCESLGLQFGYEQGLNDNLLPVVWIEEDLPTVDEKDLSTQAFNAFHSHYPSVLYTTGYSYSDFSVITSYGRYYLLNYPAAKFGQDNFDKILIDIVTGAEYKFIINKDGYHTEILD